MDPKPSDSRTADAATLARDLVDRLTAISVSLSNGPDGAGGGGRAPRVEKGGTATFADFRSPRAVLENGAGYVAPFLPAEASLRPVKALLLRVLRVITRDQTVFNSAILESLRGTLLAADAAFREAAAAIERARAEAAASIARTEATEEALRDSERRIFEALEKSRSALEDALRAAADLYRTQVRVDGLEKDRDRLSDAAAASLRTASELQTSLATLETRLSGRSEELRLLKLEWSTLRSELGSFPGVPVEERRRAAGASGAEGRRPSSRGDLRRLRGGVSRFGGGDPEAPGSRRGALPRGPRPGGGPRLRPRGVPRSARGGGDPGGRMRCEPGHGGTREGKGAEGREGRPLRLAPRAAKRIAGRRHGLPGRGAPLPGEPLRARGALRGEARAGRRPSLRERESGVGVRHEMVLDGSDARAPRAGSVARAPSLGVRLSRRPDRLEVARTRRPRRLRRSFGRT